MEEKYYFWLHNVSTVGQTTFRKILKYATPREFYENNLETSFDFLNKKQREHIQKSKKTWDLDKEWNLLKKRGIHLYCLGEKGYPKKLSEICDPPPVLYHKGKTDILDKPSVAVVGARACSNYGCLAAKELGRELARAGIVVVSGMARGIDGICQWEVMKHEGESIGVLGCGVEVCYPPENKVLYEQLQSRGAVISENSPFTAPSAGLFPLRNRIISGLADFVVVVEAREKSGTLITVDMALEQGRDVYVFPGRITDTVSRGCNKLMKQGAGIILSVEEFLEEICPLLKIKYQEKKTLRGQSLSSEEKRILDVMDISLMSIEEIYQNIKQTGDEPTLTKVMEILLELRLKGILGEENGYYFLKNLK